MSQVKPELWEMFTPLIGIGGLIVILMGAMFLGALKLEPHPENITPKGRKEITTWGVSLLATGFVLLLVTAYRMRLLPF